MNIETLKSKLLDAQKGNKTAYNDFLNQIQQYIRLRVQKKIFDKNDHEDVIQNILIGIHRSLLTFHPSKKLTPWINAIIEFKSIDYIRKKTSIRTRELQATDDEVTNLPAISNTDYEMIDLINSLPKKYSEPILLTKVQGFSTKEAALKMKLKENALRTRLSRGIKELKRLIKEINHE